MNGKAILFYVLFLLFIVYNLITLRISPIVWTDEVFLNSVTIDFIQHHTFYSTADLGWVSGMQTMAYGPLYFILQGICLNMLGNNIFSGRLVGLLAGLLLIFIFTYNFRKGRGILLLLLFICVITDEFFISSMHRGRNDTLSMLFYYSSLFVLIGNPLKEESRRRNELTVLRSIFSGLLLALSILTTVRTGFLIAPFVFIFIYKWGQASFSFSFLKNPIVWSITIVALYIPWILLGFGSISDFLSYYQYLKEHFPYFVSAWFRIPREVFPLFILFFVALIAGLMNPVMRKNTWYWVALCIVVSYFVFVGDTGAPAHTHKNATIPFLLISLNDSGPYCIIILPVFYILLALCIQNISSFAKIFQRGLKWGVVLLLVFNVGLFAVKSTVLYATAGARDVTKVDKFIHDNIPEGSNIKVCGDEIYYYSVVNNNNPFHLAGSYQSKSAYPQVESYACYIFDYDYLIISKRMIKKRPELVQQFMAGARLVKVADYTTQPGALASTIAQKLHYDALEENYDGTIYKRIRN